MTDIVNFKGHFSIQSLDLQGNVIDEWADDNMIMESARQSMAEIFTTATASPGINKIVLGTKGHIGDDIVTPKGFDEGFTKYRDRLFSVPIIVGDNYTLSAITGDLIKYTGVLNNTGTSGRYYMYNESRDIDSTSSNIIDFSEWIDYGEELPFSYEVDFELPKLYNGDCVNIVEDGGYVGSTVNVSQSDTSVVFTFDIAADAANGGGDGYNAITEAALYANGRIFSMKTFRAKIKDSTILLRIVWKITF